MLTFPICVAGGVLCCLSCGCVRRVCGVELSLLCSGSVSGVCVRAWVVCAVSRGCGVLSAGCCVLVLLPGRVSPSSFLSFRRFVLLLWLAVPVGFGASGSSCAGDGGSDGGGGPIGLSAGPFTASVGCRWCGRCECCMVIIYGSFPWGRSVCYG